MKFEDITDLDFSDWKNLGHIHTKSLWIEKEDYHLSTKQFGSNEFHGRFHPEIPYQMISRYTRKGEYVWDCFAGSGTTIDVATFLERKCVANDIRSIRPDIIEGDSRYWRPPHPVQLVILHPPYWKMVKFSNKDGDLSNEPTVESFIEKFSIIINNVTDVLESQRMLVLVISDVYYKSEQIPLDCLCYNVIKPFGYKLKGRIVKGFGETRGGSVTNPQHKNLWRYRRLKGGFWELGLDWILVFQRK